MLNSVDVQLPLIILLPEEGVMVRIPGAGDKSADNTCTNRKRISIINIYCIICI